MTSYPPPDDDSQASPLSGEAVTPRGGFMARPGLKSPPRHAVVVRGGNAPQSEHIPRFRSSIPPPPPEPEPEPEPELLPNASEKITMRAIPTPVSSKAWAPPQSLPRAIESLPPPSHAPLSDAPYVSSVSETASGPTSQRPGRSRWTIVAAAAAGLVLGLASVAARVYTPGAAEQPSPATTLSATGAIAPVSAPSAAPASARSATAPRAPSSATPELEPVPGERKLTRPATPSAKRTIF